MNTVVIPLGVFRPRKPTGLFTIIDEKWADVVLRHSWSLNAHRYAGTRINNKMVFLHRMVLRLEGVIVPPKMHVDHIDRNPLNNTFANLRVLSCSENVAHGAIRKNNTSGFKNVSYDNREKRWHAYLKKNRRRYSLGYHATAQDAAVAVNKGFAIHFPAIEPPNKIP